jgi:hypothetical protein
VNLYLSSCTGFKLMQFSLVMQRFVTQPHHGIDSEHLGQQTEGELTRRAGGFVPEGTPEFE